MDHKKNIEEGIVFSASTFAATKGILDAIFEPIVEKKLFNSLLISSLSVNVSFFSVINLVRGCLTLTLWPRCKIWLINCHCFDRFFSLVQSYAA